MQRIVRFSAGDGRQISSLVNFLAYDLSSPSRSNQKLHSIIPYTSYFLTMSASSVMPYLQNLSPVTITPTRKFKASEPLALLEKIDRIEINNTIVRDGVVFYVLDVYLKHSSSRIPTNKIAKATCSDRPDYQLERRFNDFANMRYHVWAYAQRKCQDRFVCRYCNDFMSYIIHSMSQPRLLVKLTTGVEMRKKLMTTFSNEFIGMAIGGKTETRTRSFPCDGFQAIPYVIERFFRK